MPFFGDDFFESERVAAMDDSAVMLYAWLLWRMWKHGPLPGPEVLRRLPHRWQAAWAKLWPQVEPCFERDSEGRLVNERLMVERGIALALAAKSREGGRKGGLAAQARLAALRKAGSRGAQAGVEPPLSTPSSSGSSKTKAELNTSPHLTLQSESSLLPDPVFPEREATAVETTSGAQRAPRSKKPRAESVGDHPELIRFWESEWRRTRPTEYAIQAKHGVAMAKVLKLAKGNVEEVRSRITRLLEHPDPWMSGAASPCLLESKWNELGVEIVRRNGHDHNEPKAMQALRNQMAGKPTMIDSLLPAFTPARIPGATR